MRIGLGIKSVVQIMLRIFWPPKAPIQGKTKLNQTGAWWIAICLLAVIPLTAILHHLIFYFPTCMLNPVEGSDYTPSILYKWLSRDPSLPWAIVCMVIVYHIGNFLHWMRYLVAPAFLSFLPLSIWIWDIPFTGRFICHHFHDGRLMFMSGYPVKSKYFYLIGIVLYCSFLTVYLVGMVKETRIKKSHGSFRQ